MEEIQAEEGGDGGGAAALAMAGPQIKKHLTFLVVYVWQAEDLPKMDNFTLMGGAGIEGCAFAVAVLTGARAHS